MKIKLSRIGDFIVSVCERDEAPVNVELEQKPKLAEENKSTLEGGPGVQLQ